MSSGLLTPCLLFRVQLVGIEPPIWRSFLILESATFHWLHRAILAAGSWRERHRYAFQDMEGAGIAAGGGGPATLDASTRVANYFTSVGQACLYQYNPEERWQLEVRLIEKRGQSRHDRFLRRLVGGARAYPPDDCGGVRGYETCLAIRSSQPVGLGVREIEKKRAWLGDWQPEAFDFHRARGAFDV